MDNYLVNLTKLVDIATPEFGSNYFELYICTFFISRETDSIFDSKRTSPSPTQTKNNLSAASINSINGESPFVSSAGEGGVALNHSSVDTEELLQTSHSEQVDKECPDG